MEKLNNQQKRFLLYVAKESVVSSVKGIKRDIPHTDDPVLLEPRGAFVTLKKHGELRGCIGYVIPIKPLYLAVWDVAREAALNDPRFTPVKEEELNELSYEISALSPLYLVNSIKEIKIKRDGLMIKKGMYSGLLLPQVPVEEGWNLTQFLSYTCLKAGLPPDCYKDPEVKIYRFEAEVFSYDDV